MDIICKGFIIFLFLSAPFLGKAQNESAHQFHSWFYYIGDHKISSRWGIHPEIQFRRTGLGTAPQELVIRSAINYHPTDRLMLSFGYVYARQYPYGIFPADFRFPEHRVYQQAEYTHKLNRLDLVHRSRLEQRWIADIEGVPDPDSPGGSRPELQGWPFENRLRYQFGVVLPLQGNDIGNKEYYLFASNEVFFSFGKNSSNKINQNRAQLGIGYQAGSFGRVEMGYLLQYLGDPDRAQVEFNHTFTLAWISRFNFIE